jgi:hypothetical protein
MPPIPRSGAGADSRVTNTSSYFPNSKKLIFFTEYHFKPDGVTAIKKRIGKVLRTKELVSSLYFMLIVSICHLPSAHFTTGTKYSSNLRRSFFFLAIASKAVK